MQSDLSTIENIYNIDIKMTPTHEYAEYAPGPWLFPVSIEITKGSAELSQDHLDAVGDIAESLQKPPYLSPEPSTTQIKIIAGEPLDFYIGEPISPSNNKVVVNVKSGSAGFVGYD